MNLSTIPCIKNSILQCHLCDIRAQAISPVPGEGNYQSKIVFLGRNPGKAEDIEGRPFVGPSGRVVNRLFFPLLPVNRRDIWLDNVVHCFTLDNEEPHINTVKTCIKNFLYPILTIIQPRLIITFGSLAAYVILGSDYGSISRNHGKVYITKQKVNVIPCLHPGCCLYNSSLLESVKYDATIVAKTIRELSLT